MSGKTVSLDTQQIELIARAWLEARLIRAGFEVAQPARDRGVDLIVYGDTDKEPFWARPIQLKAASTASFSLYRKYADRGIVMAYVWNALSESPKLFLVPYDNAVQLLGGSVETPSWTQGGAWVSSKPGKPLRDGLERYADAFQLLRPRVEAT